MGFFDRLKRPVIEPAAPEQPAHVPSYAATPELSLGWYRRDETGKDGKAMIGLGWRLFDSNGVDGLERGPGVRACRGLHGSQRRRGQLSPRSPR